MSAMQPPPPSTADAAPPPSSPAPPITKPKPPMGQSLPKETPPSTTPVESFSSLATGIGSTAHLLANPPRIPKLSAATAEILARAKGKKSESSNVSIDDGALLAARPENDNTPDSSAMTSTPLIQNMLMPSSAHLTLSSSSTMLHRDGKGRFSAPAKETSQEVEVSTEGHVEPKGSDKTVKSSQAVSQTPSSAALQPFLATQIRGRPSKKQKEMLQAMAKEATKESKPSTEDAIKQQNPPPAKPYSNPAQASSSGTVEVAQPSIATVPVSLTPAPLPAVPRASATNPRGRGSGRGRGRGGGLTRGKKRKREDSDEDEAIKTTKSDSDSDSSSLYTPQATQTKSGRQIHRPMPFVPAEPPNARPRPHQPEDAQPRKKVYRGREQSVLCEHCLRGHGPPGNQIVFCDGCNRAWHQRCHGPVIEGEVVKDRDREWYCTECKKFDAGKSGRVQDGETGLGAELVQEAKSQDALEVPNQNGHLTRETTNGEQTILDRQREYLTNLPHAQLVELLLQAATRHPDLPIFPSNIASSANSMSSSSVPAVPSQISYPTPTEDPVDVQDYYIMEPLPYPKVGNGVKLPPESEDLNILLEGPESKTFSHSVRKKGVGEQVSNGLTGGAAEITAEARAEE